MTESTGPEAAQGSRSSDRSAGTNVLCGVLLGLGLVAFVDETVFHQLLHWHHFYDRAGSGAGLVSDGLFHAFSWFATVAAGFLYARLRREHAVRWRSLVGGLLVGAGFFQLYDGLVQHKLLGLHQIRYDVDLVPYDLLWNLSAAVILVAGAVLLVSARSRAS
ncbi:DUF2243 domain-containing protein [Pseudonocardia sp. KRD291]|uniref:DUF2243 domain-containing protein n=1 Tax=Pseudonocardia sp. KRD291 TaxID=2792007 RepID=UPI001C5C2733|nr:DUF2243 domain-containing protein [Pseudonocardia sp. KRD291]MBW0101340.1 DUF2243 domain-containing protein [Pseudonocardia sp. KRD291]